MTSFHSDYRHYLFDRGEVAALLASSGFPLKGLEQNVSSEPDTKASHEWMRIYAAKSALRTYEVAWIMEGKEPPDYYPKTYPVGSNEKRYLNAINDAVLMGDIATKNTQWHIDDEPQTWLVDHQAVIEWCQRAGYEWPLSHFMQPALTDNEQTAEPEHSTQAPAYQNQDELKHELDDLRKEVAELRSTVEELKKSVPLHPGHLMAKAIQVQHKHWTDLEGIRPKADVIIAELRAEYPELSEFKAKAIEAVACPVNRKR
jgi:hypothetical protein